LPNEKEVSYLDGEFWGDKKYGRFSYLKLHGSQWWKSASGSNVMVIGSEKSGAIEREPYLKWSHSIFEKVLAGPDAELLIIGYGFFDQHINRVIADAIKNTVSGSMLFHRRVPMSSKIDYCHPTE
jgi:hypothetical protein